MATIDHRIRHTPRLMSETGVGSIDVGPPDKTGDNWQFGVRPSESVDAAKVEIVTDPDPSSRALPSN